MLCSFQFSARLAKWLSNDNHWLQSSLATLMVDRLIALDKNPVVCPIAIGEVFRRLNVYSVGPKDERRKLAELISSAEDCKQA